MSYEFSNEEMTPEQRAAAEASRWEHPAALLETDSDKLAHDFAYDVYNAPDKRVKRMHGYDYDPELSKDNIAVYYNPELNKLFIAHRGSSSLYDWVVSDGQIATGTEGISSTDRFNTATRQIREAYEKYNALHNGVTVDMSGHSLGASAGQYAMSQLGQEPWMNSMTGFNGGASLASTTRAFLSKTQQERDVLERKMVNIRQTNDVVSGSRPPFGKMKTYQSTNNPSTAHSLDSFNLEGVRVHGRVEEVKRAARNAPQRFGSQLTGHQLKQIAASRVKQT